MAKKKLILYGAVVALFCVFWAVYALLMMRAIGSSSEQSLHETTTNAQLLVDKNLQGGARDLLFNIGRIDGEAGSAAAVAAALQEQGSAEYGVIDARSMADQRGRLVDAAGTATTTVLGDEVLKAVDMDGYAYLPVVDTAHGWNGVALVVPFEGAANVYIAEVYTHEQFAALVTADLTFNSEYLGIFNNYGSVVYEAEDSDAGLSSQIQGGALEFAYTADRVGIDSAGLKQSYNVYIALSSPSGWFLGVRLHAAQAVPMYSSMIQTAVLALVSWILLISLIIFLDITNDKDKKQELVRASKTDTLTGLVNSAGMEECITEFFSRHEQQHYSLVVVDLVAFSRFNTMFGSVAGDDLLRVTADTLQSHYHCATRMGGDVFAFVARSEDSLAATAEGYLNDAVLRELGRQYDQLVSYKFGVYPIMDARHSFREVYDGAIIALKDAKKIPEQAEVVFDAGLQQSVDLQRNIEINMLHALSKEEFLSFVQPKFEVASERCCAGEVLVRWESEQMGMLRPDQFIPLFEKNGFIVELDFYMLRSAVDIIQRELRERGRAYPLSVNLSRVTLTFPNFLERLRSLVETYEAPVEYLELEITESALEHGSNSVIPLILEMKQLGFSIAMDDFGTGFSSLNTLRELPVDVLKIDKEFLRESDTSGRSRKIIRNITNMSRELGIQVVCEGVETASQLEFLQSAGCDIAQGFYFAKPMPYEQYEAEYLN